MKKILKNAFVLLLIIAIPCWGNETTEAASKSVLADRPQILHGLGWIEGHYVTNSLEAFQYNYKRGFRVFEVDLNMTSDNRLVARHDWTLDHYGWLGQHVPAGIMEEEPLPYEKVMSLKIHGKYHPVSWEQLLGLIKMYPDIYLVTDTKHTDEAEIRKTFTYLVNATKEVDPSLLNHIIPQIYNQSMLGIINSYHHFKDVIYTLYKHTNADIPNPKELAQFCVRNHVTAVAGLPFRLTEEMQKTLQDNHITIYTHTINKPEEAAAYKEKGIGIYTDYLYYDGKHFISPS